MGVLHVLVSFVSSLMVCGHFKLMWHSNKYVWNLSRPGAATNKHSLYICIPCFLSVRVLEANAMGHTFCMRAVPRTYLLLSMCICAGLVKLY